MPGISSNLLAERLRSLESDGVLRKRDLPPPAASTVYELTPDGRELETAVMELGKWGSRRLPRSLEGIALPSLGAISVAMKAFFHRELAQGVERTYQVHLGPDLLTVAIQDGELVVEHGEADAPDAVLQTDMEPFLGLFTGQLSPEQAVTAGLVEVEGDSAELVEFLRVCHVPPPASDPI